MRGSRTRDTCSSGIPTMRRTTAVRQNTFKRAHELVRRRRRGDGLRPASIVGPARRRAGRRGQRAGLVGWYNAEPTFSGLELPEVTDQLRTVIIGHGNVALDCARVLAAPSTHLDGDRYRGGLGGVAEAPSKRLIHVVGRRGATQAAFTTKECRELTELENAALVIDPAELKSGRHRSVTRRRSSTTTQTQAQVPRPGRRFGRLRHAGAGGAPQISEAARGLRGGSQGPSGSGSSSRSASWRVM